MQEPPSENRRSFFVTCIYGLWTLISAGLIVPAAAYLLLPPRVKREGEWVEAGSLADLQTGVPEELVYRRIRADGWKITSEKSSAWVVKLPDKGVMAFAPQCTHLGCAYRWDERRQDFLCPCHSSAFGIDGRVLSGPAPRPLDTYEVKIEGNKLFLGPIRSSKAKPA